MSISGILQSALFLIFVGGACYFPVNPAVGFLLCAGAVWASSQLPVSLGDALELAVFYGALGGIAVSFFT